MRAPFDGVITARNTDVGALINAGHGPPTQELFHIASMAKLRVYVNVPQMYSRSAVPGLPADLTLAEFPGRRFHGTLVRNAESIDAGTRTLLSEVDVDNASGELKPGAYAEVHLAIPSRRASLILPVNAFLFRSEGCGSAWFEKAARWSWFRSSSARITARSSKWSPEYVRTR